MDAPDRHGLPFEQVALVGFSRDLAEKVRPMHRGVVVLQRWERGMPPTAA